MMARYFLALAGAIALLGLLLSGMLGLQFAEEADWSPYLDAGSQREVRILRDRYGVPHVHGKTDADVAFGLAYAHAEDDFRTIQQSIMTSRGRLSMGESQLPRLANAAARAAGLSEPLAVEGGDPMVTDYLVQLLKVRARVEAGYDDNVARGLISKGTHDVLQGYAEGLNLFAARHPDRVLPGFEPVTHKDIAAGFAFFLPLFFGFDRQLRELFEPERKHETSFPEGSGSNAMAIAPTRSADGHTRLLINSHQPYAGPLAWYEARLKSDEGLDIAGGLFPASPFINHGFGPTLGWANTVNTPDLVDVYVLTVNPDNPDQYRFDGQWVEFEKSEAEIRIRLLGPVAMTVTREVLWSRHGPVIKQPHGTYALRYSGIDRINQVEGYRALNRAKTWDDFVGALKLQAIPSFNFTYADATGRIAYIYNAVSPDRDPAYDWRKYLPGDTSRTLWRTYLPFDAVPRVVSPRSGYVFNANNHPFLATSDADNPKPDVYPQTLGIESLVTNRALRFEELLAGDDEISADDFRRIKFDKRYSQRSELAGVIRELVAKDFSKDPDAALLIRAQDVLRGYDLSTDAENRGAALAIITALPVVVPTYQGKPRGDAVDALRRAAKRLMAAHGRLDPPWGDVNRFRRGNVDSPANGGPDVLRDFEASIEPGPDGTFTAAKGDTLYYFVSWDRAGRMTAEGIHQFGSATLDETSPHYADQALLFLEEKMKPIWMDETVLRQNLLREYRPGDIRPPPVSTQGKLP
jgi:penicillin amidase/acyl-homoserine-lactone acylase